MDISIIEIINIIAIAMSPAIAVFIGRWLENKAEQRKDKMEIFKILMTTRIYGWTYESVKALNIIDIVFANDKDVRQTWKNLYTKYCISKPSDVELKEIEKLRYKLIENIAISLGYKDKITWETIQSPYMPEGMKKQVDNQNICQQLSPLILSSMYNMISQNKTNKQNEPPSSKDKNDITKKE